MKATTPTPGPWVVVPCPVGPGFEVHQADGAQSDGAYICDVDSPADADLIAAAPDLKARLLEVEEWNRTLTVALRTSSDELAMVRRELAEVRAHPLSSSPATASALGEDLTLAVSAPTVSFSSGVEASRSAAEATPEGFVVVDIKSDVPRWRGDGFWSVDLEDAYVFPTARSAELHPAGTAVVSLALAHSMVAGTASVRQLPYAPFTVNPAEQVEP